MRVAHILRKYNPAEWGGTETAVQRLLDGLRAHEVDSIVYCPLVRPGTAQTRSVQRGTRWSAFEPACRCGELGKSNGASSSRWAAICCP